MNYFEMRASGSGSVTIDVFGEITPYPYEEAGEKSAMSFKQELSRFGPGITEIVLNVNSPGGSVFEGTALANTLKYHPAKVTANVVAVAASIASVIVMAADQINIAPNAAIMIHEPFSMAYGTASEMRKQADLLDSIKLTVVDAYHDRTGLDKKEIRDMLAEETWLFAEDAVAKGFADQVLEVEEAEDPFAMYGTQAGEVLMRYSKLPESIKAKVEAADPEPVVEEPQLSGDGSGPALADDSGSPATDPAPTADKETIQKMDKATLQSEHADVAMEVSNDAVAAERKRISEIRAAALPGYEELVDQNIENGASLADFLLSQTKAEQGRIQALNEQQSQMSDEPVGPGGEREVEKREPAKIDNQFTAGIYARMNSN